MWTLDASRITSLQMLIVQQGRSAQLSSATGYIRSHWLY
jgi:hypothetical protein